MKEKKSKTGLIIFLILLTIVAAGSIYGVLRFGAAAGGWELSANEISQSGAPVTSDIEVSPVAARELIAKEPDLLILDVRTPEEFAEGHLAGAMNLDATAASFAASLESLDTDRPVLLHCASGGRSGRVFEAVAAQNQKPVYHMTEGFNGWQDAGFAIED